jgi:putative N6-adenine-specific DNA methylase
MPLPLFLPCAAGAEALLGEEVARLLPDARVAVQRGGVELDGEPADVMRLNLESRLAQRVLALVAQAPYRGERDLYELGRSVDWASWIDPRQSLKVDVTARRSPLRSLHFAGLVIKDAVCDQLRERFGARPDVDTRDPDLPLVLHLDHEVATLYVDTSGEPLFKRGWRTEAGDAPLKETLAAAMLAAAGWRGRPDAGGALQDPFCGSGTIAIEAAQIACDIAPGLQRRFAFERQRPFTDPPVRQRWDELRRAARGRAHPPRVPVHASDVSFRMVEMARRNAVRAGVEAAIEFHGGDALERGPPQLPPGLAGTLMVNPPYGERIDPKGAAGRIPAHPELPEDFAARLAAHWKRAYTGADCRWTAWVLSPQANLPSAMRLQASRRVPLWNGPIECRLFRFDLVAGSHRDASRGADASDH